MGTILFWALCIATFVSFLLCTVDLAFNKDFHMSENLSSGMTLLAALIFLIIVCTMIPNGSTQLQNGSSLIEGINNAAEEAIPFYKYLSQANSGIGLLKFYSNDLLGFAQEFLQTVFMASVIPLIHKYLPSTITEEKRHNRIIMLLAINLIAVAITMVLYAMFLKTTVASTILNIIVAACSLTPFAFIVCKIIFGSKKELVALTVLGTVFGKAILKAIVYMIFVYEISLHRADLVQGYNAFFYILPSCLVCGIMMIGIGMCLRSVFHK